MKKSQFDKETPLFEEIYGGAEEILEYYRTNYQGTKISHDYDESLMKNSFFIKAL